MFLITQRVKNLCVIISTCLHAQKVLKYYLEYASILQVQKLFQIHVANSTKLDFFSCLQFD